MIFPGATATISIRPTMDHTSATTIIAITAHITNRPSGDGGLSCTSSAAGRNSVSVTPRAISSLLMSRRLLVEQRGIRTTARNELSMRTFFYDLALVEHDDPVGRLHRAQPMRNDEHGAALADQPHV